MGAAVTSVTHAEASWPPATLVAEATTTTTPAPPGGPTTTSSTTSSTTTSSTTTTTVFVVPTSPEQWFKPSGRNQGTEGLAMALADIALKDNSPLYISETWGRTTGSPSSDHHISRTDSWAADLAVRGIQQPTAATRTAADRVASALGEPGWKGGDLVKVVDGYRFQVLWLVDGHYNHVHVGVRKVA